MTALRVLASLLAALLVACGEVHPPRVPPEVPTDAADRSASDHVDPSSETSQPGSTVDRIVGRLVAAGSPSFDATRRGVDDPYPLSPDGPLPRRVEAWSFAAGEPEPSEPEVRLRFSLRIFEFGSIDEASDALAGLAATAHGSMLLKSPLLAVRVGSSVLRLDGACTFSRQRWVEIQDALMGTLPAGEAPSEALEIRCGGTVVRTPGSAPSGGGRGEDAPGHDIEE